MGGGYQGGYGMDQARGGFEPPMGGMPEDQWAAQGSPVAGPNGWCRYRAKETGEVYFPNHREGVTPVLETHLTLESNRREFR